MSGELVPSQFRYTTTNNRDFVIGDPTDSNLDQPKYLVFQMTNQPGYNNNPHIKAEKISGNWKLSLSQNGSTTLNFAYIDSSNTFTAANTFQNTTSFTGSIVAAAASFTSVSTSGNLTVGGDLVVNGSTTSLNVVNVTVNDKNITLNKGGLASTGNGAGISIEEAGSPLGYVQVSSARTGWDLKAPGTSGIATFITNGTYSYTLPASTGTLALTSDVPNISNMVTTDTVQSITGTKTFNTVNATTFNGNLIGSLDGLTLPSGGLDGQMLTKAGSAWVWTTPIVVGTDANAVHLTGNDTILGIKDFRTKIALGTVSGTFQGTGDYSSDIEFTTVVNGVPSSGQVTRYNGNYLFGTSASASSSTFVIALGLNSIEQSDASVAAVVTRASNKLSLELKTTESAGSSIILKDRTTGARYEVYVNSGVLTVGLA